MRNPNLMCSAEDLYTIKESENGNKSLTYPVGLITADEVALAGGYYVKENYSYYLYASQQYWTLTPYMVGSGGYASVFRVDNTGALLNDTPNYSLGVRPVINLRSDIELTGTGTITDPYIVVGGNS